MERYNPVVRERQRQHMQELFQQTPHQLFQKMDKDIGIVTRTQAWVFDPAYWLFLQLKPNPHPTLNLGRYSWRFYMYMHRLQLKLCKEWNFCKKVHNLQDSERMNLTLELADFLVDKRMHRAGIDTAAVALLTINPKDLCGCEDDYT